jgi:hypothetical protein
MTLFSYLFFIRTLESRKGTDLGLYVVCSILLYYTHNTAIFVLMAQGLYLLIHWQKYQKIRNYWLLGQVLILIGLGPDLLTVLVRSLQALNENIEITNLRPFMPMSHIQNPPLWMPLYTVGIYIFSSPSSAGSSWLVLPVGIAFLVGGTALFAIHEGRRYWLASVQEFPKRLVTLSNSRSELLLVGLWLLCPIVMPMIISKLVAPMYLHRYTISASPALYILVALVLTRIRKIVPEAISVGTLVILIVPGLQDYYAGFDTPPWREITAYVSENSQPGYGLIFSDVQDTKAFAWYYKDPNLLRCNIGRHSTREAILTDIANCTDNKPIWLISGGDNPITDLKAFFETRFETAVYVVKEQHFVARENISVYLFQLDKDSQ